MRRPEVDCGQGSRRHPRATFGFVPPSRCTQRGHHPHRAAAVAARAVRRSRGARAGLPPVLPARGRRRGGARRCLARDVGGLLAASPYYGTIGWHRHEMLFGYAVAVIAGFLLTAVRNWTGLRTPDGPALAGLALLWAVPGSPRCFPCHTGWSPAWTSRSCRR